MCIEYIEHAHIDLARRRRHENGTLMKTGKTARKYVGMLNVGSDVSILVLCGPVVGARGRGSDE